MSNAQRPSEMKTMAGLRLRAARLALEVDRQDSMAAVLQVEPNAYGHWERGFRMPDVAAMVRLFELTGIGPDWIYAGSLRSVPYKYADTLKHHAEKLNAFVDGPENHRPMIASNPEYVQRPKKATSASSNSGTRTLHEPSPKPIRRADI